MRVRGLDRGTAGAYLIIVATLLTVIVAFFIGMGIKDAYSQEAEKAECLITREVYTAHSAAMGHEPLGEMPPRQVPAFIAAFNKSPPALGGAANAIMAYRWAEELPVTRLAFFMDDCLVDHFDVPNVVLQKIMEGARSGDGI